MVGVTTVLLEQNLDGKDNLFELCSRHEFDLNLGVMVNRKMKMCVRQCLVRGLSVSRLE